MIRTLPALPALLLLAACASIPDLEKAALAAPIDCARASEQIATLSRQRPGAGRAFRAVGSSLTPGGFAIGVATNDMADRGEIASGRYAAAIDARIAEIRESCNLPAG